MNIPTPTFRLEVWFNSLATSPNLPPNVWRAVGVKTRNNSVAGLAAHRKALLRGKPTTLNKLQQHWDVAGAGVRGDDVGLAISIHLGHGYRDRTFADMV